MCWIDREPDGKEKNKENVKRFNKEKKKRKEKEGK